MTINIGEFIPKEPLTIMDAEKGPTPISLFESSKEKKIGFKGSKKGSKSNIITQWEKDNTLDC